MKFLFVFALLSFLFYAYIGVTVPGGKIYFPMLARYFNLVSWFTSFLAHGAGVLLTLMGYSVKYRYPERLYFVMGTDGVAIGFSCMGVQVMAFWIAFVVAHTVKPFYKLKWVLSGLSAIVLLNMARIAMVGLANHNHVIHLLPIDHHTMFNICAYIVVFILLIFFIKSISCVQQQSVANQQYIVNSVQKNDK